MSSPRGPTPEVDAFRGGDRRQRKLSHLHEMLDQLPAPVFATSPSCGGSADGYRCEGRATRLSEPITWHRTSTTEVLAELARQTCRRRGLGERHRRLRVGSHTALAAQRRTDEQLDQLLGIRAAMEECDITILECAASPRLYTISEPHPSSADGRVISALQRRTTPPQPARAPRPHRRHRSSRHPSARAVMEAHLRQSYRTTTTPPEATPDLPSHDLVARLHQSSGPLPRSYFRGRP